MKKIEFEISEELKTKELAAPQKKKKSFMFRH